MALQKQCREYERQMENLSNALERERELNTGLRDMMKEEKIKGNRINEQLDKETQNVRFIFDFVHLVDLDCIFLEFLCRKTTIS